MTLPLKTLDFTADKHPSLSPPRRHGVLDQHDPALPNESKEKQTTLRLCSLVGFISQETVLLCSHPSTQRPDY